MLVFPVPLLSPHHVTTPPARLACHGWLRSFIPLITSSSGHGLHRDIGTNRSARPAVPIFVPPGDAPVLLNTVAIRLAGSFIGRFLPRNRLLRYAIAIQCNRAGMLPGGERLRDYGWECLSAFLSMAMSLCWYVPPPGGRIGPCMAVRTAMIIYASTLMGWGWRCRLHVMGASGHPIAMVGGIVGYMIRCPPRQCTGIAMALCCSANVSALSATLPPAPLYSVTTIVEIAAVGVWNHVIIQRASPPHGSISARRRLPDAGRDQRLWRSAVATAFFHRRSVEPITVWIKEFRRFDAPRIRR
jgi:hypothetical protein